MRWNVSFESCQCFQTTVTICLYSNSNTISEKGMDLNPWFLFNVQSFSTGSAKVG